MAQVQFKSLTVNKVAPLPPVRRLESLDSWYKSARKAIPQIPELMLESYVTPENGGWYLFSSNASLNWIVFELKNGKDEKAAVIIDRTKSVIER